MCGIAGIINLDNKPIDFELLYRMTNIVGHRGPDNQGGVLINPKNAKTNENYLEFKNRLDFERKDQKIKNYSVGLSHRRLSIIDLSKRGHQPMSNKDNSLWIVHNGEIYNYLELRNELISKGYVFYSETDTEVVVNSYKEWGANCLNKFNGMWAFAIWDVRKRRLFCARDRFGVKPFYYYLTEDVFLFSSEIKQILEYKDYRRKPNEKLIYDYIVIGLEDHTEESFFESIFQLHGGEYAILDYEIQNFKKERYYDLGLACGAKSYGNDYYNAFRNLFFDAVNIRLRSDVPLGSCLSGGLDSSAVVCTISEICNGKQGKIPLETFTACWKNEKVDERKYSEEIVAHTGAHGNNIFPTSEELHEDLSKLIWHQEEPFGSLSIFAQWAVMKAAHQKGIPVLLDGQGGDEVFLGYERYYALFLMSLLKNLQFKKTIKEIKKGIQHSKLGLAEIIQYYFYFNFNHIRALRLSNKANSYINTDFMGNYNLLDRLDDIFGKVKNIVELQQTEIHTTQLSHLLKYADRNSMAFSIETRLPFLDYRLVEFALSIPSEFHIRDGWTKNLIREGMKGIIPDSIRNRNNKIGFEVPQDVLIKSILPEIKTKLAERTFIGKYFNEEWLLKMIRDEKINNITVWKALCLELWFREFFD